MKTKIFLIAMALMVFWVASCHMAKPVLAPAMKTELSVIPAPLSVEKLPGFFAITPQTQIYCESPDPEIDRVARYLAERLATPLGYEISISTGTPGSSLSAIALKKAEREELGPEGYSLNVTAQRLSLEANSPQGFFYGVQTIFQLLPPENYAREKIQGAPRQIPCVKITDRPRYRWRGFMLDVSRHFHPKEFIKSVIDDLAMHKMNTFHWHLCDDQGWRIEIKKYPRLTEVGAWRVDREDKHWILREAQKEGEKAAYGGFYTQEDIKEIVAYARSRFVMIVPEIEMPGHCLAALAAYPEYSCSGGPFTVPPGSVWPIKDVYCPGKDETFAFLESILAEVIDLFPGEYIHIGGDEVDKSTWKACPKCQARIAGEGLKNEEELQSYFIRRIEMFLNSRNKKLIGWDEILEGGLAPNAAVMSWRGTEGGIAAARQGHDVVMTPTSHCYFDYYQGEPQYEPLAIGGYLPLSRVYSYEPTPEELTADEAAHILGAQANLWTEYVPSPSHARYMMFPRLAALSELAWSAKERKNWEDFAARLNLQFRRYEMAKMNYARSAFAVAASPSLEKERKELTLALQTEIPVPAIRFTLDGSDPSPAAKLYKKPLRLKKTTTVKAAAFDNGQRLGMSARFQFNAHQALGKPVELKFPYKEEYSGSGPLTLTDGLRGSVSQRDGRWQGFEQDDFQALIDLGKPRKVDQITAGFLQNIVAWIFLPASIEIAVSRDGQDYKVIASWQNEVDLTKAEPAIKNFSGDARGAQVRFIRVEAKNIGTCPPSHPAAGGKAWLFVDEIIVD